MKKKSSLLNLLTILDNWAAFLRTSNRLQNSTKRSIEILNKETIIPNQKKVQ
jgi:hypothetical protein